MWWSLGRSSLQIPAVGLLSMESSIRGASHVRASGRSPPLPPCGAARRTRAGGEATFRGRVVYLAESEIPGDRRVKLGRGPPIPTTDRGLIVLNRLYQNAGEQQLQWPHLPHGAQFTTCVVALAPWDDLSNWFY